MRRLLFVSGLNGASIAAVTFLFSVVSLLLGDWFGTLIGLAAFTAGMMELKGRRQLKSNLDRAGQWLTLSQVWLFCIVVFYAAHELISLQIFPVAQSLPPELQWAMSQLISMDASILGTILRKIYQIIYITIISVSFFYQGSLFLFYKRSVSKLLPAAENHSLCS